MKLQAPNTNLQRKTKLQAPNQAIGQRFAAGLGSGVWCFPGSWLLDLGVFVM